MKVSDYVATNAGRLLKCHVFTDADFDTGVNKKEAVIGTLNRMVASGRIAKLSKGKYYKPENTTLGNIFINKVLKKAILNLS